MIYPSDGLAILSDQKFAKLLPWIQHLDLSRCQLSSHMYKIKSTTGSAQYKVCVVSLQQCESLQQRFSKMLDATGANTITELSGLSL